MTSLVGCTGQARGTIDIDVNVFVDPGRVDVARDALPAPVRWTAADTAVRRNGQTRLWWDRTPIDLFCDTTPFHREVATRAVRQELAGHSLPFLGCSDLAVFKAFVDRTKHWADLEAMVSAGSIDVDAVVTTLEGFLGAGDQRIAHFRDVATRFGA